MAATESQKSRVYPFRLSPVALAFESEIKRVSIERGLPAGDVMKRLSQVAGVGEKQLYNYRTGKTDIPALMIPRFCRHFGSNALAMAIVTMCNETKFDDRDSFDLTRFCSQTVRDVLKSGDEFLEAFDDGGIDGHELSRLSLQTAKMVGNAHRLLEVATDAYERRPAAA